LHIRGASEVSNGQNRDGGARQAIVHRASKGGGEGVSASSKNRRGSDGGNLPLHRDTGGDQQGRDSSERLQGEAGGHSAVE
jgi:hypothetical protein